MEFIFMKYHYSINACFSEKLNSCGYMILMINYSYLFRLNFVEVVEHTKIRESLRVLPQLEIRIIHQGVHLEWMLFRKLLSLSQILWFLLLLRVEKKHGFLCDGWHEVVLSIPSCIIRLIHLYITQIHTTSI